MVVLLLLLLLLLLLVAAEGAVVVHSHIFALRMSKGKLQISVLL